jgi:hypothetical protein
MERFMLGKDGKPLPGVTIQRVPGVEPEPVPVPEGEAKAITVTGQRPRGSVIGNIPPEITLNQLDIRAYGAATLDELLQSLSPQTRSGRGRGDQQPVVLLNGKRSRAMPRSCGSRPRRSSGWRCCRGGGSEIRLSGRPEGCERRRI